ncbi:MAG: DUF1294 domain-containing protein [Clostridia bacterium]|nr:DUF1294 domain-containing protein [Clostridia bacterium]
MYLRIYSTVLLVVSFLAFLIYGIDKRRAVEGKWRIPEKVLLSFSFFGGAIGGYLGMKAFRHKTKHWYFYAINILGLAWQVGLLVYIIILEL